MEESTCLFFALERRKGSTVQGMAFEGKSIDETQKEVVEFYTQHFAKRETSEEAQSEMLKEVTEVSKGWKRILDEPITMLEMKEVLASTANGKSPGLDGLPAEFWKWGWDLFAGTLL